MELWFSEKNTKGVKLDIKIKEHLYSGCSAFQKIDVLNSYDLGKMLILDGVLMLTEKDEFIYHEMITHIPMGVNPDAEKILVIGAGDGGTASQLIKYSSIKQIDIIEIDELVVDKCREYFPHLTNGFDDSRVNLKFEDGLKYVRGVKDYYDIIIVDSTDPFGPGEGLFSKEFYGSCYQALNCNGIIVNQHESPFYPVYEEIVTKTHKKLNSIFNISEVYQAHIPTYPSGHWLFGFSSKGLRGKDVNVDRWNEHNIQCRYYNTDLHKGAFLLPTYVKELLK